MLRNEIAESYSFIVFVLFFSFFEDSPCLFPEWLCWHSCPPKVNEKPSFPQPPQPWLSVAIILAILTGVWWNLKVALIWIPLLIKNDEYSHAIKACSPVPPQDGGTLLCYRGEVQGPLSRVLLMGKTKFQFPAVLQVVRGKRQWGNLWAWEFNSWPAAHICHVVVRTR